MTGSAVEQAPVVIGITGASGAVIAKRTIEILIDLRQPVVVVASSAARRVWHDEGVGTLDDWLVSAGVTNYRPTDIGAPIASGSFKTVGMLIVPCSMNRVGEIASGISSDLVSRSADVTLKEGRPLVLVPRDSPLSVIHLTNLLRLAQAGVRIVLPVPAFYTNPQSISDIVDQIAGRALAGLGLEEALDERHRYRGPASHERDG